ncbi:MAG: DinB family protein [Planctomycetota bacterium]
MNPNDAAARLARSARSIEGVLVGLSADEALWRPEPKRWSMLEVACHLLDEEREDFRLRLDYALHRPDEPFPPIDPEGWCEARGYRERELTPTLEAWRAERDDSLSWLRGLGEPDLAREHAAPWGGTIAAGDLLASWVAHDLLHLRQLLRLEFQRLEADAKPFGLRYAGDW